MPPPQNRRAVQQMVDAFNKGDLSIVDQLVDPTHTDQTPFPGTAPNRDGLKAQINALRQAFPDAQYSIDQMLAQGETVAYRWKMVGTHTGPLFGHGPTNVQITHSGNDFVTFANGKIVEHHSADNIGELLDKLGIPHGPGGPGGPAGPPAAGGPP